MNETTFYLFDAICRLVKEKTIIEIGNIQKEYMSFKKIVLSKGFFQSSNCQCCGICCNKINTSLFTFKKQVNNHFSAKERLRVLTNNSEKETNIYCYYKKTGCVYLKDNKCNIHKDKPLQCRITPIHIDKMRDTIYIRKRQYKRNFRFGCGMLFEKFNVKTLKSDIILFEQIQEKMQKIGINTFLPEIIQYLNSNIKRFEKGELIENKIIYSSNLSTISNDLFE